MKNCTSCKMDEIIFPDIPDNWTILRDREDDMVLPKKLHLTFVAVLLTIVVTI